MYLIAAPVTVENVFYLHAESVLLISFTNIAALFHLNQVFVELEAEEIDLLLRLLCLIRISLQFPLYLNGFNFCLRFHFFVF